MIWLWIIGAVLLVLVIGAAVILLAVYLAFASAKSARLD
jgi:hypothetical protein